MAKDFKIAEDATVPSVLEDRIKMHPNQVALIMGDERVTYEDFGNILFSVTHDDRKGIIALGGSISKHHAILCTLLNGGANYAVYMTTAHQTSGSMSGATTKEAKSWGKIQSESDIATVNGDVTITFPLAMMRALEELKQDGLL